MAVGGPNRDLSPIEQDESLPSEVGTMIYDSMTPRELWVQKLVIGSLVIQAIVGVLTLSFISASFSVFGVFAVRRVHFFWIKIYLTLNCIYTVVSIVLLLTLQLTTVVCDVTGNATWCDTIQTVLEVTANILTGANILSLLCVGSFFCYYRQRNQVRAGYGSNGMLARDEDDIEVRTHTPVAR